jgi:hypothetical protein
MSNTFQIGRKSRLPFQRGMIQWCHALKQLFAYVKARFNVKWMMTCRVNSDHVENFFSQIRGLGGAYNHPGPDEMLNRMRLLMITNSEATAAFTIEKSPVQFSDDASDDKIFVTASVTSSVKLVHHPESVPDELFEPFFESNENDENNNSSVTDSKTAEIDCSEQGLIYFTGYLAFCFRSQFPDLGSPSEHLNVCEVEPWMREISRGGLICPTQTFIDQIKQFEVHFKAVHGEKLSKSRNVIKTLYDRICNAYPCFPSVIIRKYVRCRTFFRIRYENSVLVNLKTKTSLSRRNAKKMKHFTT